MGAVARLTQESAMTTVTSSSAAALATASRGCWVFVSFAGRAGHLTAWIELVSGGGLSIRQFTP